MIHTPTLHSIIALNHRSLSFLARHKLRILISILVTVSVISFGTYAMNLRSRLLSRMTAMQTSPSTELYYATRSAHPLADFPVATPSSDVLGASSAIAVPFDTPDVTAYYPTPLPMPTDFPAMTPFPTPIPLPAVAAPTNCAGTANENNSQVYLSSATAVVGSSVTVSIELRDCNNALASNDNLSISQQTNDSTAKINGQSGSVHIQAVNGKASFTVTSQNAGTDTFLITDTNQHFPVTMPGYHNPSITFANNTSGNSNCTTPGGTPNGWYSDVYPNPPVSTTNGSQQMLVVIRDCNRNAVSSDTIKVSISSGDSNAKINGGSPPATFSVTNGQANFTVSSQVSGTVTLLVQDTTAGFTVTDPKNNPPSIAFSTPASSGPTPTPAPQATSTPTLGPTSVPAATPTLNATPTSTSTSSATTH